MNIIKKLYRKFFPKKTDEPNVESVIVHCSPLAGFEEMVNVLRRPSEYKSRTIQSNEFGCGCGVYLEHRVDQSEDGELKYVYCYAPFNTPVYRSLFPSIFPPHYKKYVHKYKYSNMSKLW